MAKKKTSRIRLVRAYDISPDDSGYRVLVDRLWPRGIKKEDLAVDAWLKEIAPSQALRKWFNHQEERWDEFRQRYFDELEKNEGVAELRALVKKKPVLLIYAAHDEEHNNAVALRDFLLRGKTPNKKSKSP